MKWSKEWDNINPETCNLLNGRILVRMPPIKEEDIIKKESGIITTSGMIMDGNINESIEKLIEKMQREITKGELVKASPIAFPEDAETKPKIGDMVSFYPYSGNICLSDDGYLYRSMKFADLTWSNK